MSEKITVAVFAANSQSGSGCVEALVPAAHEYHVVAIVRSEAKAAAVREIIKEAPVEIRIGADANDHASMVSAFAGVQRLFLVTPTTPDRGELTRRMIHAAKEAGVEHVVVGSSWTAAHDHPLFVDDFARSEQQAAQLFPHHAVMVRGGYFMTNLLGQAHPIKHMSKWFGPYGDATITMCDPRDIGTAAAAVLTHGYRVYEEDMHVLDITGPESFTASQVAQIFSEVLGREVEFVNIPPEAVRKAMEDGAAPQWEVRML
jgi:uncharacterized protein YbjT (DUF2867 family)